MNRLALILVTCLVPSCATDGDSDHVDDGKADGDDRGGVLEMNDLSVLFPLPALGELDGLLSPTSAGDKGPLLPRERYDRLPNIFSLPFDDGSIYPSLRVVGVRFDPCFPGDAGCEAQIRMVLQPLQEDVGVIPQDAALHVFYTLSSSQFSECMHELVALKHDQRTGGPLGVHPILQDQGLAGDYATKLRALLLRYAGAENLTRITFMKSGGRGDEWTFGGFDVKAAGMTARTIPATAGATTQMFTNPANPATSFEATITPPSTSADDLSLLFDSAAALAGSRTDLKRAVISSLRVDHPDRHNPSNIDCVTCHVSTNVRAWADRAGIDVSDSPERYRSKHDLSLDDHPFTNNLRAFGYNGTHPEISQRTANEAAAVTDAVNEQLGSAY